MIQPGSKLAHYEIVSALGKGGMGEVWRAKDTKLGREVAIKTLPAEFAQDADRLARFEREAKLLASLNHPNIAAIHGFEEDKGTHFLVMELVEGDTLGDRLQRGGIRVEESLNLALQIADALKAAHEKGVIHRDLKPANIKVTDDDTVKVLDFGLAKAFAGDEAEESPSDSPTLSMQATQQGVILGTAAYMSPEQAKGRAVDKRTDVFSFGCVLFEMLTGRQSFGASDITESLAAVIRSEPKWDSLPLNLHPRLRETVERCLEKPVARRYQDIGDVRTDLERIASNPTPTEPPVTADASLLQRAIPLVIVAVLTAGLVWYLEQQPSGAPVGVTAATLEIVLPEGVYLAVETGHPTLALSPEGEQLIFVGVRDGIRRLYLRNIDDSEFGVVEIEGTEGADSPLFSPDGTELAFFADSRLKKVSPDSGIPTGIIRTAPPLVHRGGAWIDAQTFVHAQSPNQQLSVVQWTSDQGLLPQDAWSDIDQLPAPSSWPDAIPGKRQLLFTDRSAGVGADSIGLFSLDTGQVTSVMNGGTSPKYSSTGHILYARSGALYAINYDADSNDRGDERLLVDGIEMGTAGEAQYAISRNGTLAYVDGDLTVRDHELVWVDRNGDVISTIRDDGQAFLVPRLSPDESQIAFSRLTAANEELFVLNLIRGDLTPWTSHPGEDFAPAWHPDGGIAFSTEIGEITGSTGPALGWMEGPNDEPEELLDRLENNIQFPASWSPDGRWLAYSDRQVDGDRDIYVLDFATRMADPFAVTPSFVESTPMFSPDGAWIAYVSDRSGEEDVWIAPFPGDGDPQRVSTEGGFEPDWSGDGNELFYREGSRMMSVTFSDGPGIPDPPQPLFTDNFERGELGPILPNYDVSADGSRFVMVRRKNPVRPTVIRVVLNWPEVFGPNDE